MAIIKKKLDPESENIACFLLYLISSMLTNIHLQRLDVFLRNKSEELCVMSDKCTGLIMATFEL